MKYSQEYIETLGEILLEFGNLKDTDSCPEILKKYQESEGRMGVHSLAQDLASEFQSINKDRKWDGEFLEEIEDFIECKMRFFGNKTLSGAKAKEFFEKGMKDWDKTGKYPTQRCGGFWREVNPKNEIDGCWVAFDNHSEELFCEAFSKLSEAMKYANQILAHTSKGTEI